MKMMSSLAVALVLCTEAFAFGGKAAPVPVASPSPSPRPTEVPLALLVTVGAGTGTNVDRKFLHEAIDLLNKTYSSGCLQERATSHAFKSFNSVYTPSPKNPLEAYKTFTAGAPYALDVRWYSKRFTKTIGYTYNFKNDDWNGASETRIWTNTRKITDAKMYASHLAHELSHQARAGGFVHYTIHQGSFPYEIGDVVAECLSQEIM